ncbi:hypothetical protein FF38_09714 [Lucilia cuprina]|uniref:CUB domain-containing protein n=1 Tax=Lucilia cuprina TaxID=7375 RepID=A0A0L0BX44_LUCCU|nr:uncharacterized protein LOC111679329 [Lucilia cuprina]KAI8118133.1 hypothetical protein CVS40_10193 [Lucilia cuprina]KNC24566.1 hypothetical protein FF38_09714 [Lucilia cuprina]
MWFYLVFLSLSLINSCLALELNVHNTNESVSHREARRSPLTDSCVTSDDTTGTCMSRFKCLSSGGIPKGYCSSFGVCCETNLQCNMASRLKRTIIKNPAVFNSNPCIYTIQPYSPDVCQLLIQFERFEMQPPNYDAGNNVLECGDNLSIGDFTLCGDNNGQHLYLPFNVASGVPEITLTFNLPNRWSASIWRLVVTQLECPAQPKKRAQSFMPFVNGNNLQNLRTIFTSHSNADLELLAPHGCHQYYTQLTGSIKSFNYKPDGSTYYLPNMNYVICIKPTGGVNMIEYQAQKFSMSNAIPGSPGYDGDCRGTIQTPFRREDYLMIPQSYVANSMSILPTYYCGTSLQTNPSLVASAPFIMYFSSDEFTDTTETGFDIRYTVRTMY